MDPPAESCHQFSLKYNVLALIGHATDCLSKEAMQRGIPRMDRPNASQGTESQMQCFCYHSRPY